MFSPPLTITFLGTGTSSGVPMIACPCEVCASVDKKDKRLRSSILVQSATTTIVVDTTPDFRYQMLRANIKNLDALLFTHPHKDHIAGLDDVRAYNFFQQKPMPLYCNALTEEALRKEFAYAFSEHKYPGLPNLEFHDIPKDAFLIGDITVQPIPVMHLKMPVLGFRFGKFTYITDANFIDSAAKEMTRGSEVMVLNALRKEKHISHFNLEEAIALVRELQVPQAYFTHLSHQMGLHATINTELPTAFKLAYDGLQLKFD